MKKRACLFCAILSFGMGNLFTETAQATWKAAKIAITENSSKSVVILKTKHISIPYPYQTGFRFTVSGYNSEKQALAKGGVVFGSKEKRYYNGYLVREIKSGTYVFKDFSRQDRWALCFNDDSLQFTVKPGQAIYLGELFSRSHLRELEKFAVTSGRTSTNSLVHFFDGVTAPVQNAPRLPDLEAVATMMKTHMPKTTVQPILAQYKPARFGTGSSLFGLNKVCGGYYSGSAKPKKQP